MGLGKMLVIVDTSCCVGPVELTIDGVDKLSVNVVPVRLIVMVITWLIEVDVHCGSRIDGI